MKRSRHTTTLLVSPPGAAGGLSAMRAHAIVLIKAHGRAP
jgi:hypothetical protein